MEMILGVVADGANRGEGDKLNILGIFHHIAVNRLPAIHPQMSLALEFRAMPLDKGRSFAIRIPLLDPDGGQVMQMEMGLEIAAEAPALQPVVPISINIVNVRFERAGNYRFEIYANDKLCGDIQLEVMLLPAMVDAD